MKTCTDCHDPPGGEVCCEGGLTPICIIQDGKAQGTCRKLSQHASESPAKFIEEMVDIIAELAGERYRNDASDNILFFNGGVSYESSDENVRVRATQVPAMRGSPAQVARS